MPSIHWITFIACAAAPLAGWAGQTHALIAPAQPDAVVAAPAYTSALSRYQRLGEDDVPPDQNWRQANHEMGSLGGHAGHLQAPSEQPADTQPVSGHNGHRAQDRR